MRFDDRFLEEVKSRLRLSDVIGRTVRLRRQGREYVGLSPFTKERTPSFFVNDDKGFFHDFSSGKHGDLISFLQETERLSFIEAVERLAAEAGVPLPAPDPQAVERDRRRQGLAEWLALAAAWFQAQLGRPAGAAARAYLQGRGWPAADCEAFGIGYAPPGRTALKDHLIAKGALPADLVQAGLLIAPDDGSPPYDRFRDRIVFPIADDRGRVISFGGRAMDPAARAKYLNGPETALFDKAATLFGLAGARRLLNTGAEGAPLLVVEGYFDVLACQRAGLAAVAPMGTALTEAQMARLWRLHLEPTLTFDGDRAGQAAAGRALDRALPLLAPQRSFRVCSLPPGVDPDELIAESGAAAMLARIKESRPFADALFERERDAGPLDTPEARTGLRQRLRALAGRIGDGELAGAYRDALNARCQALFAVAPAQRGASAAAGRRGRWRDGPPPPAPPSAAARAAANRLARRLDPVAAVLARQALALPELVDDHLETLQARGFGDPALAALAGAVIQIRLECDHLDTDSLRRHLAARGFSALLNDIDRAATHAGAPFEAKDVTLAAVKSQWSHAFEVQTRVAALEEALTSAKADLAGPSGVAAFMALKAERDALRRDIKAGRIWSPEEPS